MAAGEESAAAASTGATPSTRAHRRRAWRTVAAVVVLGLAVHLLLPQVAEVDKTLHSLRQARPLFIVLAVLVSALSYAGTALSLRSAAACPLPWRRAGQSTLAASALQAVTPANVGTFGLYAAVLRSAGCTVAEAASAVALNALAPVLVGLLLLIVASLLIGQVPHPHVALPQHLAVLVVVLVVLVLAGLLALVWWCRRRGLGLPAIGRRVRTAVTDGATQLRDLAGDPRRAAGLLAGAVLSTGCYVGCLTVSVHAFGGSTGPVAATVVYVIATAVAAVTPTPGGLGAVETAMVSGLTLLGSASGPAIAGVLLYRLVTFWLPIPFGALALHGLHRRHIG